MHFKEALTIPGEHALTLTGAVGNLESILTVPDHPIPHLGVLLGHPHSLQGGTMQNKVVTTLVRTFKTLGIPSLRFNFRGVGQSEGTYDAGIGESNDMLLLANGWQKADPSVQFIFAGFSFGSYVAYCAARQHPSLLLITIAPPVNHCHYDPFKQPCAWLIVQGDDDEVVPANLVFDFAAKATPDIPVLRFSETGHFFHGKLIELKDRLTEAILAQVSLR